MKTFNCIEDNLFCYLKITFLLQFPLSFSKCNFHNIQFNNQQNNCLLKKKGLDRYEWVNDEKCHFLGELFL